MKNKQRISFEILNLKILQSVKKLITLLFSLFLLTIPVSSTGTGALDQKKAETMALTLSSAKGAEDSIKILYDIYDLTDREKKKDVGLQILELSKRTNNREVTVDMLNRLSSKLDDPSALKYLMDISTNLPEDSTKKSVELILKMESAKSSANQSTPEENNKKILEYAQNALVINDDIYQQILDDYSALVYLGTSSQGSLYMEYITQLLDLVKELPPEDYAIKNLVYSTAIVYYTRKQMREKAVEVCRDLLNSINQLEKLYDPKERRYLSFDYVRYAVYRRMLENYKVLKPEEIQSLYDQCVIFASRNDDVAKAFESDGLTKSFYNMAVGNYKEAVPELRKALESDTISVYRRQALLGLLVEALDALGDKTAHYEALKQYVAALQAEKEVRISDAMAELELRNEVNRKNFEQKIELEEQREAHRRMRKVAITLVYVLAITLILMCSSYFRLRQKVKQLTSQNKGLHKNIEQMFDDGTPLGTHDARLQRGRLKG